MHVFPQDAGTGVPESNADYVDAATLAQLVSDANTTDYIVEGFHLSPDYNTPAVTVSSGVAKISDSQTQTPDHTEEGGPTSKTVENVTYTVQTDDPLTTSITDGTTNEVYLSIDPATKDYVDVFASSDGSTPPAPYLHIGTVDTGSNTASTTNREPDIRAESVTINGETSATEEWVRDHTSGSTSPSRLNVVTEYDADNTGESTADTAVANAISDASAGDVLYFPPGTYKLEEQHVISKTLTLRGQDATIRRTDDTDYGVFRFVGDVTDTSTTTTNAALEGDARLTVEDTSGFSPGDQILIRPSSYSGSTGASPTVDTVKERFQFATVQEAGSNVLYLTQKVSWRFDSGVSVEKLDLLDNPTITGFDVELTNSGSAFLFQLCDTPVYRNCRVTGFERKAFWAFTCWRPSWVSNIGERAYSKVAGSGEPFKASRCQDASFKSNISYDTRRSIDLPYYSHNINITDHIAEQFSGGGIASHESFNKDVTVTNCVLDGSRNTATTPYDETLSSSEYPSLNASGNYAYQSNCIALQGVGITVSNIRGLFQGTGITCTDPDNQNHQYRGVSLAPVDGSISYGAAVEIIDGENITVRGVFDMKKNPSASANATAGAIEIRALNSVCENIDVEIEVLNADERAFRITPRDQTLRDITVKGSVQPHSGAGNPAIAIDNGAGSVPGGTIDGMVISVDIVTPDGGSPVYGAGIDINDIATLRRFRIRDCRIETQNNDILFQETMGVPVDDVSITNVHGASRVNAELDIETLQFVGNNINQLWQGTISNLNRGLEADTLDGNDAGDLREKQVPIPLTTLPDGETAVGLRKHTPSGTQLAIKEMGVQNASGNSVSDLQVEVYDHTHTTTIASESSKFQSGDPLATQTGPVDVSFRVSNSTGATQEASGFVTFTEEES